MNGRRLGSRQLERMGESLSGRDLEILLTVSQFRLATARQVEELHFRGGDGSAMTKARTARGVLERLTTAGLLSRLERRVGGVRAGSASYVYAASNLTQRLLHPEEPRQRLGEPSAFFASHTLAITESFVGLRQAEQRGELEVIEVETEPTCWRAFTGNGGGAITLKPDLFVAIGAGDYEHRWFIEVDLGTEHRPTLQRKAQTYVGYWQTGEEQTRHGVFPQVLWKAPTEARVERIRSALAEVLAPNGLFVVTTAEQIAAAVVGGRT